MTLTQNLFKKNIQLKLSNSIVSVYAFLIFKYYIKLKAKVEGQTFYKDKPNYETGRKQAKIVN